MRIAIPIECDACEMKPCEACYVKGTIWETTPALPNTKRVIEIIEEVCNDRARNHHG